MRPVPVRPQVIGHVEVDQLVRPVDLVHAVRDVLLRLGRGGAVQPAQTVVDLTGGADVICYHGLDVEAGLYGVKVSPYLPQAHGPAVVTAWTLLLDTRTGDPVALVDASSLTAHRTAAASVIAAQELLAGGPTRVVVVGTGALARAHARYVAACGLATSVAVVGRDARHVGEVVAQWRTDRVTDDIEIEASSSLDEEARECGLLMLCTSAAAPLVDLRHRPARSLTTSISTNAPQAHEIRPASLQAAEVYVDLASAAMPLAAEFGLARADGLWRDDDLRGDLPGLLGGGAQPPQTDRPRYFRSVGLGLEDVVAAGLLVDPGP